MKKYILSIITGVLLFSCEKPVEGLNDNPNAFTDSPISLLLNHTLLNLTSIAEAEPARFATIFTDQFTGVDRQYGSLNIYTTESSSYEEVWEDFYGRGISQAQITKQKAQDGGNALVEGQALILEGYYFAEAALVFNDIPFSEVNSLDFADPNYEQQEVVLRAAIDLITQGVSKVGSAAGANNVFATTSTWAQIGNALKARYLLALGEYQNAHDAAVLANFSSTANDWSIKHSVANYGENLFWQFEVEQRGDYLKVENSYMSRLLKSTESIYRGHAKTDETARYNYYVAANGLSLNTTTTGFAAQTRAFPVISFEEVQLIIAEAAARLDLNDNALAALNKVRVSNAGKFKSKYDAYVVADFQTGGMAANGASTLKNAMIKEVLFEKYCSVIGLPTFQDVLRTNNLIGVPIKNSNAPSIPQRFLYSAAEQSSNSNFPGLVGQYVKTDIYN
jgi:hypothetical protein